MTLGVALLSFLAAALISLVGTAFVRTLALRYGIADHPNERRINTRPVPRAGGVAVAASFVVVGTMLVLAATPLGIAAGHVPLTNGGIAALLLGTLVAALLGLIDDRYDLRARWQLATQLGVALVPIAFGLRVAVLTNPFGSSDLLLPDALGLGVTIFWILGMQNAMNFIDGLDGLSGGIAAIAALTLAVIAAPNTPLLAALCVALAGALVGFLRHNFHPASIYIGTSGILSVAYALAAISLLGTAKVAAALLILGVPIIDAFFVIAGRIAAGRSPFSPDNTHIHRRLLDAGIGHRAAVLVIYAITVALSLAALLLTGSAALYAFAGVLLALGAAILYLSRRGEGGR